jgi:hypothetical protein
MAAASNSWFGRYVCCIQHKESQLETIQNFISLPIIAESGTGNVHQFIKYLHISCVDIMIDS